MKSTILITVFILSLVIAAPRIGHAAPTSTTCSATADFSVDFNPSDVQGLTLLPSTTGIMTVTLTPLDGFTGPVTLKLVNIDTNLTATFPSATTVTSLDLSSGPQTVTVTVTTSSKTVAGSFLNFDVNATAGTTLVHDTQITVYVPLPDLDISAAHDVITTTLGSPGANTINLQTVYGLTDSWVNLTAQISSFGIPSASLPSYSFIPSNVTLSSSGAGMSTITITATSSTTPGPYSVVVVGTTGSGVTNNTQFLVRVEAAGFRVDASPAILDISPGATKESTINVTSVLGFTGIVSLSNLPVSGLTVTINPQKVDITTAGSHATANLGVMVASTVTPSSFTLIVIGTGGAAYNFTTVYVTVPGPPTPTFSVTASPSPLTVSDTGPAVTSTVTLQSLNGFAGNVNLSLDCSPDGLTATLPSSVSLTAGGTNTATLTVGAYVWAALSDYVITVSGTNTTYSASNFTSITVTVTSPTPYFTISATPATGPADGSTTAVSTIAVNPFNGFTGSVALSATPPSELTCQPLSHASITPSGTSSLSCTSGTAGTYSVTITGTSNGYPTRSATATFTFNPYVVVTPDIALSISTPSLSFNSGASGTATITVSPVHGFSGTVQFSASASTPSGVACTFNPASVQVSGATSSTTTLTCNGSSAGDYTVTLTETQNGGAAHTKDVTVHVAAVSPVSTPPSTGLSPAILYAIIGAVVVAVVAGLLLVVRSRRGGPKVAS